MSFSVRLSLMTFTVVGSVLWALTPRSFTGLPFTISTFLTVSRGELERPAMLISRIPIRWVKVCSVLSRSFRYTFNTYK